MPVEYCSGEILGKARFSKTHESLAKFCASKFIYRNIGLNCTRRVNKKWRFFSMDRLILLAIGLKNTSTIFPEDWLG